MLSRLLAPLALLIAACAASAQQTPAPTPTNQGAVSAADPRAAEAGVEVLRAGGTAADAAFAMMVALTVVEPQSSGIGGGGFLVYHDQQAQGLTSYDGRETAPHAATPAYFLDAAGQPRERRDIIPGGMSVGVPGNISLMAKAHEDHGRLPWARLFQPAIRIARDGFAITPRLYRALESPRSTARLTSWSRGFYYQPDGTPKPVGTVLRNTEFAAFLEQIAARGPEAFYTGPAAEALVQAVRGAERNPSIMTRDDVATYQARERDSRCGTYRGHRICGMGPPSSGATTVFAILKQLERFDLRAMGRNDPRAWHLIADSMRLAYADRAAYLGDPDFVRVPVEGLMDEAYLASRAQLLSVDRAIEHAEAGTPPGVTRQRAGQTVPEEGTTHFVAVDSAGNVATYTSTIESAFGSGITVNGMFLNNELTDFNSAPEYEGAPAANRVEGGKRPLSSMSPTIVYAPDGEVRLAVGAAGGLTIISQVAKAIIGVLDWDMSAQDAIAMPQILGMGDRVMVERGTALESMVPALTAMGHQVTPVEPGYKANAIERVNGRWVGAADPRSEGTWLAQ
ncbi:gamma-glutamyltransferase [Sphingosinicella sp. LHD-64]|uniref:gamma-glutamyltransferase n=1 Tax=Sphingosinicella sp. LHD-64 TaxID=3072139 RepID=UPI00280D6F2C|nr:gamma-glutamyltransferase [Sphingosinicella sp. LHD-64]MDQ8756995.1 gamma-glutamyltransferase [Sphingosinicella sp. LHD-64]